ncbi:hypothetical protein RB653_010648 [Dictyostelium firmibasis]|uniref:Uncharacterized protein n=1 Tax=Dictyostelium firmibasis TaxID=79012 RepID=A0AAN7U272_9MYCE
MKFIFSILIIIQLISFINIINCQIVKGPKLNLGYMDVGNLELGKPNVVPISDEITFMNTKDLTNSTWTTHRYNRYDWSFLRIYIRNNQSGLLAYVDFHPRVDEFTTIKFSANEIIQQLNTSNPKSSIIKNRETEGYTIWAEIPYAKNITTFTSRYVNVLCQTTLANGTIVTNPNKECQNATDPTTATYRTIEQYNSTVSEPIILPPKHIFEFSTSTFVSYFTIIFQLDNGAIVDAIWDGDRDPSICKNCDSCIDDQCATKFDDMRCNEGVGCQLKFFLAWAGVDNSGKNCASINKIPSKFQKYSATAIKNMGTGLVSDFFYKINDNNNNPNTA